MKDYIKRIQSNLSGKKIKLGRPVIREELELLGLSAESLTDELAASVINKLVDKFSNEAESMTSVQEIEPSQNSEISHQSASTNLDADSVTDTLAEAPTDFNHIDLVEIDSQIVETESETETEIVVSESEKHDLITAQSSILDVQLSELETIELCSRIPDVFDDYKSFVGEVTNAIKAFVDDKFDHQETSTVDDSISELRQHIAARQARLDTKFSQGLNDVKEDLEQIRSNIKSRQVAILERFRIPAKT